eukprot:1171987-Prymnesium_polylepis.1
MERLPWPRSRFVPPWAPSCSTPKPPHRRPSRRRNLAYPRPRLPPLYQPVAGPATTNGLREMVAGSLKWR